MPTSKALVWDNTAERFYETGVSKVVLFPKGVLGTYPLGVAWNGISNVTDNPSGAEPSPVYANNQKYLNLMSTEEYGCSIEAFTWPDEFNACDGAIELAPGVYALQQNRSEFGLAFRTEIGNDVDGNSHGYKIHLVYGGLASPSDKAYGTINETPEGITFSWEVTTTPVMVTGMKPTASLVIDSTKVDAAKLLAFEAIIYGSELLDPRLPLPDEVKTLLTASAG